MKFVMNSYEVCRRIRVCFSTYTSRCLPLDWACIRTSAPERTSFDRCAIDMRDNQRGRFRSVGGARDNGAPVLFSI